MATPIFQSVNLSLNFTKGAGMVPVDERELRDKIIQNIELILDAQFRDAIKRDKRLRGGGALLERATGITSEKLTSIRRGKSFFSASELLIICDTFDVTLDFVFRGRRAGLSESFLQFLAEHDREEGRRSRE